MTSYAYARTHAYACFTDRYICGQIIIQGVYNEPNGISPSHFNQKGNGKFKRCSSLLRYVILYVDDVDIWSESVSSVWAVRSLAFLYF